MNRVILAPKNEHVDDINNIPMERFSGLRNGTRLICRDLERNVIHAEIATGEYNGNKVFLPRMSFIPLECDKPIFPFKRTQFLIRPCFAMTINKSEGQTLDYVGIYLPQPVFSHGQLYVALSRAKTSACIKILAKPILDDEIHAKCTKNIQECIGVYKVTEFNTNDSIATINFVLKDDETFYEFNHKKWAIWPVE
ncbi:uncharacterized protein LOC111408315 [Olea europaea var. sylvestris]|uniref:uncharacterized protein LOC111408315 n=1 Tax=Olea europaea var. sylvestris TaxID=158386 RepID=UPI000C1D2094|nr:uncharacterized protein LOC111408315 [Olea europaea var. sylvestris]